MEVSTLISQLSSMISSDGASIAEVNSETLQGDMHPLVMIAHDQDGGIY